MSAHAHTHENLAPKAAVRLAGMLVAVALLLTFAVRLGFLAPQPTAAELRTAQGVQPTATRLLLFSDRSDGAVGVTDVETGRTVAALKGDGAGFIRGVLRALSRERRMHGLGPEAPFRLTLWGNTQLSLVDTATGRTIELAGFGQTNRAAFARLLER